MCIDYTSLKKACPKDPLALPRIDQVIDSTAGYELLSFLDAYNGYHQIRLDPADRLKTAFITLFGTLCYITMTFVLRNAGATFQRCMQKCLLKELGRNTNVYVDDIVVKTEKRITLLEDLKETFANLRRFLIKINLEKCVFRIKAIERVKKPTRLRDVQKFTGCLASLSRLVRREGPPTIPADEEDHMLRVDRPGDEAFLQLKRMLSTPPVLAAPGAREPMLLYIAATNRVVSMVIVVERLEAARTQPVQRPNQNPSSCRLTLEQADPARGLQQPAPKPVPGTPEPGLGTAVAGPGTSTTQQGAAVSNPPPPNPATLPPIAVMTVVEALSWAQPILNSLVSRELPADEVLARQVQHRAGAYTIINSELVRRSATGVFQRCVEQEKGIAILRDIHQGECGHHAASRDLVAKAFRHGFFWPTALDDAKELVPKCKGCQCFITKQHLSASALKTIPITWSFAVWGLDMVGPFKTTCGGMTQLLVSMDKFTKWIEARPIKKLYGATAVTFIADITG
ncbi:uncharacterized protein [Aegilops tauschii subsp. strangulata]|uniref:uncharacterized protein n=1 Tax=Aegilops tauschii subsp. strangulata TaxID=200361 RepID=UPI003CC8C45B